MEDSNDGLDFPRWVILGGDESQLDPEAQAAIFKKKLEALKVLILWEQDAEIVQSLLEISDKWRIKRRSKAEGWDVSVQVESKKS